MNKPTKSIKPEGSTANHVREYWVDPFVYYPTGTLYDSTGKVFDRFTMGRLGDIGASLNNSTKTAFSERY